jgi:hypothetical protein
LSAVSSLVLNIVKASGSGALGIQSIVDTFPPLATPSNFEPVDAKFLEQKNVYSVMPHSLEEFNLVGFAGLET